MRTSATDVPASSGYSRLGKSRIRIRLADSQRIEKLARATLLREKLFSLLGLRL